MNNLNTLHRYPIDVSRSFWPHGDDTQVSQTWEWGTCTSSYAHPSMPSDRLLCAPVLFGFGFTNATANAETADTIRMKAERARQITSANGQHFFGSVQNDTLNAKHQPRVDTAAQAISDIRFHAGLTWEQVARLFAVSRRSVHLWASGAAMSSEHEEHLHRVLGVIENSRLGEVTGSRAAVLFTAGTTGRCVFDLLAARQYEAAARDLGIRSSSPAQFSRRLPEPSVFAERRPLSATVMVSALRDDVPPVPRTTKRASYRRVKRDP